MPEVWMMAHGFFSTAFLALWGGWLLYWIASARNVKTTQWRESIRSHLLHTLPLSLSFALLAMRRNLPEILLQRFMPHSLAAAVAGLAMTAAGLGVAIWSRWRLGRNWSGNVTVKQDHTLVRSGPYGIVRHPIYSGLLLAVAGTALAIGQWRGVLALALALLAFIVKLRLEERVMGDAFTEYRRYRGETWALIPFVY
jgi:protein-S-isoprenylcysteine O-methyltransferase Ste14